jgi:hypothetical protein
MPIKLLFTLLGLAFVCSCTSIPEEALTEPPKDRYSYYSGAREYGNFYCKLQEFTQVETGKTVTLTGMIHIADQSFYTQIDKELDKADLILEEGVHGLPSFGINKYFANYSFSIINRLTPIQGLVQQNHALKKRKNYISADMSISELNAQGNFLTPLIQLIALPLIIVGSEPYLLYYWGKTGLASATSETWLQESEAALRHDMLLSMHMTDSPAKVLIPGIIDARNALVIKKLTQNLAKEGIHSVAIPWGAAHMPGLEKDLLASGFTKSKPETWLRSIAVSDYLKQPTEFDEKIDSWGIPYVYSSEVYRRHASTSFIFSILKMTHSDSHERFSLLWGDLFDHISFTDGNYTSFLPRIAGKPLLFDLAEKDGKQRFRFLWFFSIGSLEN